jgi:flagellar M-ring protein FliF
MAAKNQIVGNKQPVSANQILERIKIFWNGLRPQQQIFLGVGLAVTLAVVAFFVRMIATPDYKPLMKGMEPADVQAISTELTAKKIDVQITPDGTGINVPSDQVDAARLEVASHDAPHSGRIGFEIFDKVSWGQTEFDEKVNYQRALRLPSR